ncbi:MAG: hypothetical protein RIM84_15350 [Alphaproteobacteria bacterium]
MALGLMLALGSAASMAQPADMAMTMAAATETGSVPDGCGGCGDDMATDAGSCAMVCPNLSPALVPDDSIATATAAEAARPVSDVAGLGRPSNPDPYPPKYSIFI